MGGRDVEHFHRAALRVGRRCCGTIAIGAGCSGASHETLTHASFALGSLHADGLIHRCNEFVFPTLAAARFWQLEQAGLATDSPGT
jgi:hypothetical protein